MSFNERDHQDQASAALTKAEREAIVQHLVEGNSMRDLAEAYMALLNAEELREILADVKAQEA